MRARLQRNFGTAANQVLWRGLVPLIGDPSFADDSVFAIDRWLARVDADRRKIPLARKIIQDKPDSRRRPLHRRRRRRGAGGGLRPDGGRLRHPAPGRRRAR